MINCKNNSYCCDDKSYEIDSCCYSEDSIIENITTYICPSKSEKYYNGYSLNSIKKCNNNIIKSLYCNKDSNICNKEIVKHNNKYSKYIDSCDSSKQTYYDNSNHSCDNSNYSCYDNSKQTCYESEDNYKFCDNINDKKICIKLTDSKSFNINGIGIDISISKHGKYIYMVYKKYVENSKDKIIEIFDNDKGKLKSYKCMMKCDEYRHVFGGYSCKKFNKFSLIDGNKKEGRLRLLNNEFDTLMKIRFKDYIVCSNSMTGGNFIFDDKYVIVSYVNRREKHNKNKCKDSSIIRILRADTLEQIYEYKYEGFTYNKIKDFEICGERYLILLINNGEYDIKNKNSECTTILRILKITEDNKIKFVEQELLPYICNYDIMCKNGEIYIIIGTINIKNKTSIYINSNKTGLNDKDNLLIYKYCDNKFTKIWGINKDSNIRPFVCGKNDCRLLIEENGYNKDGKYNKEYPGFFCMNDIDINEKYINICNISESKISINNFDVTCSDNGKWIVVSGEPDIKKYGINNIQLYKIK